MRQARTEQTPRFFEKNGEQLSNLHDEIQSTATPASEPFIKGKVFRLFGSTYIIAKSLFLNDGKAIFIHCC